jgi:hypothetical protein
LLRQKLLQQSEFTLHGNVVGVQLSAVVDVVLVEVVVVVVVGAARVVDVVDVVLVVDVDVLVEVVVDVDVVEVVVVVPATHWLLTQLLPGSQPPHWIGTPQPLSTSPHCAPRPGQSDGWQHTPNLSSGWSLTQ